MPAAKTYHRTPKPVLASAVRAFLEHGKSVRAAAEAEGISRQQLARRLGQAAVEGMIDRSDVPQTSIALAKDEAKRDGRGAGWSARLIEVDALPSPIAPAEELIQRREAEYERVDRAQRARELIPVRVKIDGPVAIMHMGDPHIDDPGTNIKKLRSDIATARKTEGMLIGNVGDLQNNWVGRLARLYGEQSTSAAESWALTEWMVAEMAPKLLYLIGGNHDCHDTETECLTRRGWLRHSEITENDHVLSFDADTGAAVWSPICRIIRRHHAGPMVRLKSRGIDLLCTPNHRVLHRTLDWKQRWRSWRYIEAASMPARLAVPVSGRAGNTGVDLSDEQLAFAGWVLTDGSISWYGNSPRVTLYQSKDSAEIERLVSALNLECRRAIRQRHIVAVCGRTLVNPPRPQREWVFTADASRKILGWVPEKGKLPDWANNLSSSQFDVLLDAIVSGDGCWDGDVSTKAHAVVHGTHEFLSSLQAVAVQHGWRARIAFARGTDARLNLTRAEHYSLWTGPARTEEHYEGDVWCLTVPLGNFMVRRNGAAHFSGNCWSGAGDPLKWIAAHHGAMFEGWGARLNLIFPNGKQIRVNARHDFAGHSQWNAGHGPAKAAQMGWRDHLLTCGHKHTSAYQLLKDPSSGLISHVLRVAGYKVHDRYAKELGLPNQNITPASVTVIDPRFSDDDVRLITVIHDVDTAADFLTFLRRRK